MTGKIVKRLLLILLLAPIVLFISTLGVLYYQQEKWVQHFIQEINADIEGYVVVGKSRIAPFKNFPYVSIDLKDVKVFESEREMEQAPVLMLGDIYVGFDLLKLVSGKMEIKSINLQDGYLDVIQDSEGALNLGRAFQPKKPSEEVAEAFNLKLKSIKLNNIQVSKFNELNQVKVDALIDKAKFGVEKNREFSRLDAKSEFKLTIMKEGDSTFFKNKNCVLQTELVFKEKALELQLQEASLQIEQAFFDVAGTMVLNGEMPVDLKFEGRKPSFDLFLSFAPEELSPVLKRYENAGDVYFSATVQGNTKNTQPHIEARFGCKETVIANQFNKRKIDQLQFSAYFTNGDSNRLETAYFELKDFAARPEAGRFKGNLSVRNFLEPEIDMRVDADFNLKFLADFFELENIYKLSGQVLLNMHFRDIVDLNNPEKALSKLDQAYTAQLKIKNLSFESPDFHLPIRKIDVEAATDGSRLEINSIDAIIGKSDLQISGELTNIIALVHQTDEPVVLDMSIQSKHLDLKDITQSKRNPDDYIDDQVTKFYTHFTFSGLAHELTRFEYLPKGKFELEDLNASFKNYPHRLHDFDVAIHISDDQIKIDKFHGEIDDSDIDLSASMSNFMMFMEKDANGSTEIPFRIHSEKLVLKDLLTYNGNNFLPEDYRNEVFEKLVFDGTVSLSFYEKKLVRTALDLKKLQAKMKLHPLKLEQFSGEVRLEDGMLYVQSLSGKMGYSKFNVSLKYPMDKMLSVSNKESYFKLFSPRLDLDQLTNFSPPVKDVPVEHSAGFNIYELPFKDMKFELTIGELNYHGQTITNVKAKIRTRKDHFLYMDDLNLEVAKGKISGKAYFDGSNPKKIYLSPKLNFEKIDLTKLLLKFDNFGTDVLLSDNLKGQLTGSIHGKIRVHSDMVPIVSESDLQLDIQVVNGLIINFAPMHALENYFKDKNLNRIAFDTLKNSFHLKNGNLVVPSMVINSSLGFIIIEGTQDSQLNMNYLVKFPFKMVTEVASQRLFKRKNEEIDPEREDEIVQYDPKLRTRFVHIRIVGQPDNVRINIEKLRKRA